MNRSMSNVHRARPLPSCVRHRSTEVNVCSLGQRASKEDACRRLRSMPAKDTGVGQTGNPRWIPAVRPKRTVALPSFNH